MKSILRLICVVALFNAGSALLASSQMGVAAAVSTGSGTRGDSAYTSKVVLCFDGVCRSRLGSAPPISPQASRMSMSPDPQGGSYKKVYCNKSYSWSDNNGTFTYQHACRSSTSPWGYRLSSGLKKIITGNVDEAGMSWYRNGVARPKQRAHPGESASYHFHGTFNPIKKGDGFEYFDTIRFKCNIGANCHGTVSIHGALKQLT